MRRPLPLFTAGLLVVAGLLLSGCGDSGPSPMRAGDCARRDGDEFVAVSCGSAEATHVVLRSLDRADANCRDVAGVTNAYFEPGGSAQLCLGAKGADPALAANTAQEGDCLTDSMRPPVRKLPCADPQAIYRVVKRTSGGLVGLACDGVAGSLARYTWSLELVGDAARKLPHFGSDVVFCLADKNGDSL